MVVVNMEKYYRLRGDGSVKQDGKNEKEVAPFWNDFLGPTSLHFGVTSLDRGRGMGRGGWGGGVDRSSRHKRPPGLHP